MFGIPFQITILVFKQYYTYFHTLFHSHVFLHMFLNNKKYIFKRIYQTSPKSFIFQSFTFPQTKHSLNIFLTRIRTNTSEILWAACSFNWYMRYTSWHVESFRTPFVLIDYYESCIMHCDSFEFDHPDVGMQLLSFILYVIF